jgi:hypothetical protein
MFTRVYEISTHVYENDRVHDGYYAYACGCGAADFYALIWNPLLPPPMLPMLPKSLKPLNH